MTPDLPRVPAPRGAGTPRGVDAGVVVFSLLYTAATVSVQLYILYRVWRCMCGERESPTVYVPQPVYVQSPYVPAQPSYPQPQQVAEPPPGYHQVSTAGYAQGYPPQGGYGYGGYQSHAGYQSFGNS